MMTKAANVSVNWLATMPGLAHTTVDRKELKSIMLGTGGQMMLRGEMYEITQRHVGGGVYRICTKLASGGGPR